MGERDKRRESVSFYLSVSLSLPPALSIFIFTPLFNLVRGSITLIFVDLFAVPFLRKTIIDFCGAGLKLQDF